MGKSYLETNRSNWDNRAELHYFSEFYDVPAFIAGKSTLLPIEKRELGDINGRSILHLQCHIGTDSLSLARLGATVTAVDFSPNSIKKAKILRKKCHLPVDFICADVLTLDQYLDQRFDIVFASYGVFCWIPDIQRWFEVAAQFLKLGGTLLVIDDHPIQNIFEADSNFGQPVIKNSYFDTSAETFRCEASYTGPDEKLTVTEVIEWCHPVSELITGAVAAGFYIDHFKEYPECQWQRYQPMEKQTNGYWKYPGMDIPFLFSLKARKPKEKLHA